ncbi:hypothetical protein HYH02_014729 [Chlamydomonas schloesseri]|uniref:Uncharacterized protein n=1 Tax=Chlamydomonas schloesseri TaxID=2026947 RepID=A0A835VV60_9CHLO|nr:hypothetical protein HYH02_014729 [Chlamydomonas schloesseri]|eukprot:KAG2426689.1 hypothetical protein HYH02_014729 [Chlamydomonas schloesseri]
MATVPGPPHAGPRPTLGWRWQRPWAADWVARTPRQGPNGITGPKAAAAKSNWQAAVHTAVVLPAAAGAAKVGPGPSAPRASYSWLAYGLWARGLDELGGGAAATDGGGDQSVSKGAQPHQRQPAAKAQARGPSQRGRAWLGPVAAAAAATVAVAGAGASGGGSTSDAEEDTDGTAAEDKPGPGRGSGASGALAALHQLQAVAGEAAAAAVAAALVRHAAALGGDDTVVSLQPALVRQPTRALAAAMAVVAAATAWASAVAAGAVAATASGQTATALAEGWRGCVLMKAAEGSRAVGVSGSWQDRV